MEFDPMKVRGTLVAAMKLEVGELSLINHALAEFVGIPKSTLGLPLG